MDPLSISASIVALLTATSSTIKFLEKVRSRKRGAAEIASVLNSITDLQFVLNTVLNDVEHLRSSEAVGVSDVYQALPVATNKLAGTINELNIFLKDDLLDDAGKVPLRRWNEDYRSKLQNLKSAVDEGRRNLDTLISSAQLRAVPTLLDAIHAIGLISERRIENEAARIAQLVCENRAGTTVARLEAAVERLSLQNSNPSTDSHLTVEDSNSGQGDYFASQKSSTSLMCITTASQRQRCGLLCSCQCHTKATGKTPTWLSLVFGTLFYTYSAKPGLNRRPCSLATCLRSSSGGNSHYTYYFPTWMLRGALFMTTSNNLSGRSASWTISMPRTIPSSARCWKLINRGDLEGIRYLLDTRQMSPYDVDSRGISVLLYAIQQARIDVCILLSQSGSDWMLKDLHGISAADRLWEARLLKGQENIFCAELGSFVEAYEEDVDLCMSTLHKIVTGLSSLPLIEFLSHEDVDIDAKDWKGMTPLMWALIHENIDYVKTLLQRAPRIDCQDHQGRTSLHLAASVGNFEIVRTLLDAGADPFITDFNGCSLVHYLCWYPAPDTESAAKLLFAAIDAGCSLEARNDSGTIPMHFAAFYRNVNLIETMISFGADFDAFGGHVRYPPIACAIQFDSHRVLSTLCTHKARSRWWKFPNTADGQSEPLASNHYDDILQISACGGSATSMRILGSSELDPVPYDPGWLWLLFYEARRNYRSSTTREDEEVFLFLLERKGIPVQSRYPKEHNVLEYLRCKLGVASEDSEWVTESEDEDCDSKEENDNCEHDSSDTNDDVDIFSDAVEGIS